MRRSALERIDNRMKLITDVKIDDDTNLKKVIGAFQEKLPVRLSIDGKGNSMKIGILVDISFSLILQLKLSILNLNLANIDLEVHHYIVPMLELIIEMSDIGTFTWFGDREGFWRMTRDVPTLKWKGIPFVTFDDGSIDWFLLGTRLPAHSEESYMSMEKHLCVHCGKSILFHSNTN